MKSGYNTMAFQLWLNKNRKSTPLQCVPLPAPLQCVPLPAPLQCVPRPSCCCLAVTHITAVNYNNL